MVLRGAFHLLIIYPTTFIISFLYFGLIPIMIVMPEFSRKFYAMVYRSMIIYQIVSKVMIKIWKEKTVHI